MAAACRQLAERNFDAQRFPDAGRLLQQKENRGTIFFVFRILFNKLDIFSQKSTRLFALVSPKNSEQMAAHICANCGPSIRIIFCSRSPFCCTAGIA